jgi:3-phenylpropionate/trans-cinnamate dioxygenase ferredoxin subunit
MAESLVATIDELQSGQRKSVIFDETPVLLIRIDDDYFAVEDVCTHDGQPLTDGALEECQIACPRHGARFDLRTGQARCMPATESIQTFRVDIREDGIYLTN